MKNVYHVLEHCWHGLDKIFLGLNCIPAFLNGRIEISLLWSFSWKQNLLKFAYCGWHHEAVTVWRKKKRFVDKMKMFPFYTLVIFETYVWKYQKSLNVKELKYFAFVSKCLSYSFNNYLVQQIIQSWLNECIACFFLRIKWQSIYRVFLLLIKLWKGSSINDVMLLENVN